VEKDVTKEDKQKNAIIKEELTKDIIKENFRVF
jgi:hypothetical protein